MSNLRIETLTGAALRPMLPALARLRITVFRAWPYLYDGDPAKEHEYLPTYAHSPRAAVVMAFDGETPVGAATCLPMEDEGEAVTAPFRARGLDLSRFFYFGESVLLPAYRGRGVGVAFFQQREAHARAVSDADFACFCAVRRPDDHPDRPQEAVPLDMFWTRRGYTGRPDFVCTMSWRDVGHSAETSKPLTFWMKSLTGAPLPPAAQP
jgi:GNAT superfamily N-acetyltransferase